MSNVKLKVDSIGLEFGGVRALDGVSLEVREGELLAIIGPNGAGKTSLINCISNFYTPQEGDIYFDGKRITRLPPHEIAHLGISRTFQNLALYTGMTTLDNLMAGRHLHFRCNFVLDAIFYGRARSEEVRARRRVEDVIDFLEIEAVRNKVVGSLPYGMRKRVELGRALASEPKLLLLDEPMTGMNVEEKEDMARFILDIQELWGISVVLIEHDMGVVMDIADRVIVLDFGRKTAEGTPEEIKVNPKVIEAYLGVEAATT